MRKNILFVVFIILISFTHSGTVASSTESSFQTITFNDMSDPELMKYMDSNINLGSNQIAKETFFYLTNSFSDAFKQSEVVSVYEGVFVQGNLYFFNLQVPFGKKSLKYRVKILRKAPNAFQILSTGFVDLSQSTYQIFEGAKINNVPYLNLITSLITQNLKQLLGGSQYQVVRVQFASPYYTIDYRIGNKVARVKLTYDLIANQVQVRQAQVSVSYTSGSSPSSNSKTFTKQFRVKTQSYQKYGVQRDGITFSEISLYNQASFNGFSRLSQADQQIKLLIQDLLNQLLPQIAQLDSKYKLLETWYRIENKKLTVALVLNFKGNKSMLFITLKMPNLKRRPTFSVVSSLETLLNKVSGVSDPTLIPFLTGSYELTSNSAFLQKIGNFLTDKVGISGDFTILLINEIRYGMRLIIQTNDENKLFEAVLGLDNSNLQLLLWRRIARINDIDPDIFNQYYRIVSDENLKGLIRRVFNSDELINKFQEIISAEKKISFDGLYYRIVVQSTNGNKYFLKFYYIPDKDFFEIIHYDNMDSGFDSNKQMVISILPEEDVIYNIARQHINKNYHSVLQNAGLAYISVNQNQKFKFFRLVFVGANGKYEIIVKVDLEKKAASTVRLEKLEDGYVPADLQRLNGNQEFSAIKRGLKDYIVSKFNFEAEPVYFQSKNIPNSNAFYKFIYTYPLPFVLTLEERYSDRSLYFRGVQRLPIAPAHLYYNDRVFSGFSVFPTADLEFDDVYPRLFSILKAKANFDSYQVIAAFRQSTVEGIYYKVIYKINDIIYLGSFSYTFSTKQAKLISFEPYERRVEAGDYRWNCKSLDSKSGTCNQCQNDFVLTLGRCYIPVYGCILQIAGGCQSCNPGLIRTRQTCASSPQKAIPKPLKENSKSDQNCLVFVDSVCQKCAYRFYMKDGVCRKAQNSCLIYNENGQCSKCYTGYYLNRGVCYMFPPLCADANSEGYCTDCYKDYRLRQGQCYVNSNFDFRSGKLPSDPLCKQWDSGFRTCLKCQFGVFLSTKTGKCLIKDVNCQQFSQQLQSCQTCQHGYELSQQKTCLKKGNR